ncbi:hypothetical protein D8674_013302 [Pyrus ussuriensis x Pyrus communis]|uniref:Uncharacterized protein n=1 Tax=Pyrus ussuriensis x Pyrus communis TaxID=2448454 RepID=A0A5N5GRX0_9ROSA|nr:hypothetical protein D8674_013302 [Pyrus ussuriensis x Pyrus communis]
MNFVSLSVIKISCCLSITFIFCWDRIYELLKQNADNRKKQKYHHKGGARPFIQHARKAKMWINNVARDKYVNEFGIMSKNLGREGKSVNGVGLFPCTDTFTFVASMASSSELTDIRDQIKILSDGFLILQQENEQLRARLDLQNDDETLGQTSNNSKESDGNNSSSENVYPELEEHDSEEE